MKDEADVVDPAFALVETTRMPSAGVAEGEVVSFVTWEINKVDVWMYGLLNRMSYVARLFCLLSLSVVEWAS